jgi:hypothetical protein
MRRSKGSQTISWVEYRTPWDGVSVAPILRFCSERVETKRGIRPVPRPLWARKASEHLAQAIERAAKNKPNT